MITVTTDVKELKKFEGTYHNAHEVYLRIEDEGLGWSGWMRSIGVWERKTKIGDLTYTGEQIFEW
jgi:hypothetical protein